MAFTVVFLIIFIIVEKISHRRHGGQARAPRAVQRAQQRGVTVESLGLTHPQPILVAARGPRSLPVLERILRETDTDVRDVVVVTCKVLPPSTLGVTEQETTVDEGDRELLTRIVTVAEEVGKQVYPVVLPTNNPLFAIATAARDLKANEVVLGVSEKMHAETQLEQFALAWGSATADPMYSRDRRGHDGPDPGPAGGDEISDGMMPARQSRLLLPSRCTHGERLGRGLNACNRNTLTQGKRPPR